MESQPRHRTGLGGSHLINGAIDIHVDDPAFGYRFIVDELPGKGIIAGENRVQRMCRDHGIWSVFSKKRGLNRKPGPPVHDDLVERDFTATAPNELWLRDTTEHIWLKFTRPGEHTMNEIAELLSVGRSTVYRDLERARRKSEK